jgi:acetyl-CoA C-acetyltransferase
VGATQKLLAKTGWSVGDVDLWEINEAFAVVPMALMTELKVRTTRSTSTAAPARWATPSAPAGARILVTLLHALQARGKQEGRRDAVHRRRRSHRHGG